MNDTYKPLYTCWYEDDFWSDRRVVAMHRQARHFYRTLLLAALFCKTRPYLPTDDETLCILADADPVDWQTHKVAVLKMFTLEEIPIDEPDAQFDSVQLYSHHRLTEDWAKHISAYDQRIEASKRGVAARRSNRPVTGRSSGGNQSENVNVNEKSKRNLTSLSIEARETSSPMIAGSGFAANDNATECVALLHKLLSLRPDVKVPTSYQTYWLSDFRAALKEHRLDEVKAAILFSQIPRNQKYYIRSKSICSNLASLVEQVREPANAQACQQLWQSVQKGKLPLAKKSKTVAAAMEEGLDLDI